MSGRAVLAIGGVAVAFLVAWWAWPRGVKAPAAPDAGIAAIAPPPPVVRVPDNGAPPPPPPPGGGVRFVVRDHKGGALRGVEITATPADAPAGATPTANAVSDDDGALVLAIGRGRWRLAAPKGHLAGADDLELDGEADLALPLVLDADAPPAPPPPGDLGTPDRSGGITGVVTANGARLPDVTVALTYLGGFGPGHPVARMDAPHGIDFPPRRFVGGAGFRWPELAPGSYEVWLAAPGFGAAHARVTVMQHGWGDASLALTPAASLSGTVYDGRGAPVGAAHVTASVAGRTLDASTTGADGIYLLDGLPAGPIVVEAHVAKDVCLPARDPVTVAAGERTTHRIVVECAWQGHPPANAP